MEKSCRKCEVKADYQKVKDDYQKDFKKVTFFFSNPVPFNR